MSQKVLSQIDADGNATVMLNRPDVHNAFDPEMVDALTATLKKLESSDKVRAVVITGSGRSFCAGADIEHIVARLDAQAADQRLAIRVGPEGIGENVEFLAQVAERLAVLGYYFESLLAVLLPAINVCLFAWGIVHFCHLSDEGMQSWILHR